MLSNNSPSDALLFNYKPSPSAPILNESKRDIVSDQIQTPKKSQVKQEVAPKKGQQASEKQAQKKSKGKNDNNSKSQKRFTLILKIFNIILGIVLTTFGVYCYYGVNDEDLKDFKLIGYIMPGYLAFSGLIIIAIEMHIGFICRNMKFLYNYFGRGFFNIYVGIMPLTLLNSKELSKQTQSEILETVSIYILVGLLVFIGLLYILAKICCCAKQGDKRNKLNKRKNDSQSDSSDNDD